MGLTLILIAQGWVILHIKKSRVMDNIVARVVQEPEFFGSGPAPEIGVKLQH